VYGKGVCDCAGCVGQGIGEQDRHVVCVGKRCLVVQTVRDKVLENSALLKELWEGKRAVKELQLTLEREREQALAVQLEYEQFRHQVMPLRKEQHLEYEQFRHQGMPL